jgi:CRISPR/Cas system Type II protein with McrA/HNH and RuvC-like nuclease domain
MNKHKEQLFSVQKGKCNICHKKINLEESEVDHIKPQSEGGPTSFWNLQLLCKKCHHDKTRKERQKTKERKTEYMIIRVFTQDVVRMEKRKIHPSQPICETFKDVLDKLEKKKK